jgi:ketosteroid isomerase-like protein
MAETFDAFMRRREQAALAYTRGDGGPVNALTADGEPVTFFGPDGGRISGPDAVKESFAAGAAQFLPDGDSKLEVLQATGGADVGYWCGIQNATVRMRGGDKPVPMRLRITEIFRLQGGAWRLVHRHADMLKSG